MSEHHEMKSDQVTMETADMEKSASDHNARAMATTTVDLIPGTQLMHGAENLHFGSKHTIDEPLYPHPTSDPSDPLNWSKLWKGLAIANVALCTFWFAVSTISMAPLFPLFIKQWDLTPSQVTLTTGLTILLLGFANLACVPVSNIYGRRTALFIFGTLFIGSNIWQAVATSYPNFLAARAFSGIAAAPCETLIVQVITDVFFLHERGSWVGFSMVTCFLGCYLGPVIAGAMGENYGWPSFFWLCLGAFSFSMVCMLFTFPETKYRRSAAVSMAPIPATNQVSTGPIQDENVTNALVGRGRPKKQQFKLYQRPDTRWKSYLIRDILVPFRICYYPIVFWAGLCLTTSACLTLVWNISQSFVYGLAPYNFNPEQVGYLNFGMAIGLVLGMLTAGPLSDYIVQRAVKRNNGVREAEMRLPTLIPYFLIITTSVGIAAAGLKYYWPWEIIVIFGFGSAGLMLSSLPTVAITYAIDCYKPVSGEIMVVGTIIKNTVGFAFSYWLPQLGLEKGFQVPVLVWYAFGLFAFLCAIPLYFWGKKLRELTKDSHVHQLEEIL